MVNIVTNLLCNNDEKYKKKKKKKREGVKDYFANNLCREQVARASILP